MSEPNTGAATAAGFSAASSTRSRSRFFFAMSGVLLLVVLAGFTRTLYLRPVFDVPGVPGYVLLHGVVMSAWFVGIFVQTGLVAARRVGAHRTLGWLVAGVGVAMIPAGAYVTLTTTARRAALGAPIERIVSLGSEVVWSDLGALSCFSLLLSAAIWVRRRSDLHKRLMLIASISMISPALSRIFAWPVFAGLDNHVLGVGGMLLLFAPLFVHDLATRRRVHAITVAGATLVMSVKLICMYVIAPSGPGQAFVRGLTS